MPNKGKKPSRKVGESPLIGILMGSDSDLPTMQEAGKILEEFAVPFETRICSAHRTPDRLTQFARAAEERRVGEYGQPRRLHVASP